MVDVSQEGAHSERSHSLITNLKMPLPYLISVYLSDHFLTLVCCFFYLQQFTRKNCKLARIVGFKGLTEGFKV